jgi:hypothetical protein
LRDLPNGSVGISGYNVRLPEENNWAEDQVEAGRGGSGTFVASTARSLAAGEMRWSLSVHIPVGDPRSVAKSLHSRPIVTLHCCTLHVDAKVSSSWTSRLPEAEDDGGAQVVT